MIGGQLQEGRRATELPFPIDKLAFQNFALQPLPLPMGEICILDGQLR